jgi:hypothetical protein
MMASKLEGPLERAAAEAVRNYIDGLRRAPHPPGPHVSPAAITQRLARIEIELLTAPPMRELHLIQERHDLHERARWYEREARFVDVARTYSKRHGITYDTWLAVGVPDRILRRAGLRRGNPSSAG